ncbi:MAG: hypothetical protein HHJ14_07130 [Cellulomonas sp.]|nr:hypothetical protein [Cellulomonas sp.]
MTFDEKNTWIYGVVALGAYGVYLATVLTRAQGTPVVEVAYIGPMLWCIGASVAASILGKVAVSARWPREANSRDDRDREIDRFGEHVGQSFLVIGLLTALVLAMLEIDHFWIANAAFLAFVLSAALGSAAKITAYRGGFQQW